MNFDMMSPGQSAVYYTGRSLAASNCDKKKEALDLYLNGEAELTQRKTKIKERGWKNMSEFFYEVDGFEYIITKRVNKVLHEKLMTRNNYYNVLKIASDKK